MNDSLFTYIVSPLLGAILGVFTTWLYGKTQKGKVEIKSSDIDNEIKSATFYRDLLDDATKRIKEFIVAVEERDAQIKQQNEKIEQLILHIESLTFELRKYKQLNGKEGT
jgi:uncharacterized membrane protein YheB (UPF0754 family)